MDVFTTRKAMFLDHHNGAHAILPIKLRCDPGNHMVPIWTKQVTLSDGRQFVFLKNADDRNKTPIYIQKEEEVQEEKSNDLLPTIEYLKKQIITYENFCLFLVKKFNNLDDDENKLLEAYKNELDLFYEQRQTDKNV